VVVGEKVVVRFLNIGGIINRLLDIVNLV